MYNRGLHEYVNMRLTTMCATWVYKHTHTLYVQYYIQVCVTMQCTRDCYNIINNAKTAAAEAAKAANF